MKIRGILLDKDGTLLEFHRTWRPIADRVIGAILEELKLPETHRRSLGEAIGLFPDTIDSKGSLSAGTNRDVARDFLRSLPQESIPKGMDFPIWSQKLFDEVAADSPFYPVAGAEGILKRFREAGILVGLSTADSVENATLFLEKSGLRPYFQYIGADDGIISPKPAPDYMHAFCRLFGLKPEEVAVVGDTLTDMEFGRNSGAGFIAGVLSGTGTRELLDPYAHKIIPGIAELWDEDRFIWEE